MQKAYSFVTSRFVVAAFALLVAVLMIIATTSPALAYGQYYRQGGDSDVRVSNNNNANVGNVVVVGANTGHNVANGGNGDDGGNGGDGNDGGDGGNGGDGGDGGDIDTGDAIATAIVANDVNSNKTIVNSCGCEGRKSRDGDVRVSNNNNANVKNIVVVGANTGGNVANGGDGEEGGNGGDAKSYRKYGHHNYGYGYGNGNNSDGGDGGDGGNGGDGGDIETGKADSLAEVVNVVNRSVTRVQR